MIDLTENFRYEKTSSGRYCIYSGQEYLGEMTREGLAYAVSQVPELLELLEELINPDELPDIDTYRYVRKKVDGIREGLK